MAKISSRGLALWTSSVVLAVVSACGGGGGSGAGVTADTTPLAGTTPLTISGTVATGKAVDNATVKAQCQKGTGTTQSASDGSYTLIISNGQLPCLVQATSRDGVVLHSMAVGSASKLIANVTQLTEMVTARVLENIPASYFSQFTPESYLPRATSNKLTAAHADIEGMLNGTVDTSSLRDFIGVVLKAATASAPSGGDAHDKILDAFSAKIDNKKLVELIPVVANTTVVADAKAVVSHVASGKGISPYIGWEIGVTPGIYRYVMQLCYGGGNRCTALGDAILMDVDPSDRTQVTGSAYGIEFDDITREELQQIINEGTLALNKVISNLWGAASTPSAQVITDVFNTALANAMSPEDIVSRVTSGFVARGFTSASGTTGTTGGTSSGSGTSTAGAYQCPTTKRVNDPDWIQSHGSYWAAASAHDAFAACLKTGSETSCKSFKTVETQYCAYAKPACLAVATNASSCPG